MLKKLKRMLVVIPCMIFGLFLLGDLNVSAAEWDLVDATSTVVVGEGSKNEKTYFFTSSTGWQFKGDLDSGDKWASTYITYQVIKPDGSATPESSTINIIDSLGEFSISDITKLSFSEKVDVSSRVTVAPAGTYYVDIRHYTSGFMSVFNPGQRGTTETVKIILGNDNSLGVPNVDVSLDKTTNEFTINASALVDEKAYSLIKCVEYYFSKEPVDNEISTFRTNMGTSALSNKLDFQKGSVTVTVDKPSEEYGYLYVMVTTHNNYSSIKSYDIVNENVDEEAEGDSNDVLGNGNDDASGWPDFQFGELILLVLVVVLIVSCVLIITQKIVDYKKRLY